MKFTIDTKELQLENLDGDKFWIKSHPKDYLVSINSHNPKNIIFDNYSVGDVVLIDEKLIDLYDITSKDFVIYPIKAVEEEKNINTCLSLVTFLSSIGFNKANTLHVVGGGIVQDIGSFTAAVYKRGVNWILYPSTLLSMCDSCIGGKNGINFDGTKNQLALFSSPSKVIISTKFIETLEKREINSGLGEILKLLSTGGPHLIEMYDELVADGNVLHPSNYISLIKHSLCVKKQVIEEDEFELTIRKSLNYGHTIGHALEVMSGYEIPHGQAVALGMYLVNKMFAKNLDKLNSACLDLIDNNVTKNMNFAPLKDLILKDKKTIGTKTTFIVLQELGKTIFVDKEIDDVLVKEIIQQIKKINE